MNNLKRFFPMLLIGAVLTASSCKKDDLPSDLPTPNGDFTVSKSGTFVAESGAPTVGTAELGTDEDAVNFLHFTTDFTTNIATGTVGVYLSTSAVFTADPGAGNPDLMLVGSVTTNGEHYFRLDAAVPSNFTHVILWCNTAGVPFGNAALN